MTQQEQLAHFARMHNKDDLISLFTMAVDMFCRREDIEQMIYFIGMNSPGAPKPVAHTKKDLEVFKQSNIMYVNFKQRR